MSKNLVVITITIPKPNQYGWFMYVEYCTGQTSYLEFATYQEASEYADAHITETQGYECPASCPGGHIKCPTNKGGDK